jgi:hypothetical protein
MKFFIGIIKKIAFYAFRVIKKTILSLFMIKMELILKATKYL